MLLTVRCFLNTLSPNPGYELTREKGGAKPILPDFCFTDVRIVLDGRRVKLQITGTHNADTVFQWTHEK